MNQTLEKILSSKHYFYYSDKVDIFISETFTAELKSKALASNALGDEQNILNLVQLKKLHTVAALIYFQSVLEKYKKGKKLKRETIEAIAILEFTQVDFADTLSEIEMLRNMDDQLYIFEAMKSNILYGDQQSIFPNKNYSQLESQILNGWNDLYKKLGIRFRDLINIKKPMDTKTLEVVDKRLTEYYTFIALDHVRDESEKQSLKIKLRETTFQYDNTSWKSVPGWVKSHELWFQFLGDSISFLVPLFVYMELNELSNYEVLSHLIMAFRGVGILNVLLDDMLDYEQDKDRNDTNLFSEVFDGKFNNDLNTFTRGEEAVCTLFKKIINTIIDDFKSFDEIEKFDSILEYVLNFYILLLLEQNLSGDIQKLLSELILIVKGSNINVWF